MFRRDLKRIAVMACVVSSMAAMTACTNKDNKDSAKVNADVAAIQTGEVINSSQNSTDSGNTQTTAANAVTTSDNKNNGQTEASQTANVSADQNVTSKGYKIEVVV